MAGNMRLCVWIAVSLMTAVVVGEGERVQDRDLRTATQTIAFPLAPADHTPPVEEFQRRLRQRRVDDHAAAAPADTSEIAIRARIQIYRP
jgi:hypothetical protein